MPRGGSQRHGQFLLRYHQHVGFELTAERFDLVDVALRNVEAPPDGDVAVFKGVDDGWCGWDLRLVVDATGRGAHPVRTASRWIDGIGHVGAVGDVRVALVEL